MTTQQRWAHLSTLKGDDLRKNIFVLLQEISFCVQNRGSNDPEVLETVPRLAELIENNPELNSFNEAYSALARATGLWNYIDKQNADFRDRYIAEAVTADELGGITLHKEQIAALNVLLSGKNLILSAPTSFGKSILVDALIASGKYKRIAIVLPTIALLDEFRKRITSRFKDKFDVIMFHSDKPSNEGVVFLGTQERLINRADLGVLDLVVVDEFYKLDPNRRDDRSVTLNAAVYQLLSKSKQFFFLGPNIESIRFSDENRWSFEFLRTRFSTVAVDTFDLRKVEDKGSALAAEASRPDNWPVLIFVSSPDKANGIASDLLDRNINVGSGQAFSDWLVNNFGNNWALCKSVACGIGVHHGRIPRAVAAQSIRLFNTGVLPILICTSTLIEGVNTAAKSVLIYDKDIQRKEYDFFTFLNIKGRAGRLGQHHTGKVFLFHSPPEQSEVEVNPPLFGKMDDAPDEMIVHFSDQEASNQLHNRITYISSKLGLSSSDLKKASVLGVETVLNLKVATEKAIANGVKLNWSGWPRYPDLEKVVQVLCTVKGANEFGAKTEKQLVYYINQLRQARQMSDFFKWYFETSSNNKDDLSGMDNIFKFLRACEYGLPQHFSVIEMYVKQSFPDADYSLFLAELPRWFRPEILKNLDEQGVPIQISERFYTTDDTLPSLSQKILLAAQEETESLTPFECQWVQDALGA